MNLQSSIDLPRSLSIDAFFDWSEHQKERYELVRGAPHMQPWVKRNHSRIASNASFLLQTLLNRDLYDVHQGDFAIATGPSTIRYADVLVEPAGAPGHARTAQNALVVVEILSPSTAEDDLGPKRQEYQGLESVEAYVVLAQDERRAMLWTRQTDRSWPKDPLILRDGVVAIEKLGIDLPIADLYRGVSID
ncbi:Uma2 family endonuclease [Aureimonas sp. Leaf427]|nr:Uma2 family endonuclease [Aureimonas sp. Leaf427]KQT60421.1 hypothetical protein ASG62_07165 [Aureimonas sp. Leaf427]KQT79299.1 hypothetical protein ASG54_09765 [Aureimonas sp. Leaf460]